MTLSRVGCADKVKARRVKAWLPEVLFPSASDKRRSEHYPCILDFQRAAPCVDVRSVQRRLRLLGAEHRLERTQQVKELGVPRALILLPFFSGGLTFVACIIVYPA